MLFRVTIQEHNQIRRDARAAGVEISEYVRRAIDVERAHRKAPAPASAEPTPEQPATDSAAA